MLRTKDISKQKNNCFPNSAFVNVVSEDLMNKLNELGYYDTWSGGIHSEELKTYTWITNCCWGLTGFKPEENNYIDCGDNIELFLAIASVKNDTDNYGVWLDFPENEPENNERVLIRRKGFGQLWEAVVYNKDYKCWDDGDGDDYYCELNDVDKFMRIIPIS